MITIRTRAIWPVFLSLLLGAAASGATPSPGNASFHTAGDRGQDVSVYPSLKAAGVDIGANISAAKSGATQPLFNTISPTPKVYPASYGSGNLRYWGGPQITNAGVVTVFWNSSVALNTQNRLQSFFSSFADNAPYSTSTQESADYNIVQQYGVNGSIASSLSFLGTYVDAKSAQSSITDSAIQSWLNGLISAGAVPMPSTANHPIYALYFPSGMKITLGNSSSCSSFCGYHSSFTYTGSTPLPAGASKQIIYAVFPYPDCTGCSLATYGLSVVDMLTIIGSHEIRESVTDQFGNAWFDTSGNEADDKCIWHNLYKTTQGFYVQPEYSNGGRVTASGFTATYPGPGCIVP